MFSSKVKLYYSHLSAKEVSIAEFILANQKSIDEFTSQSLAKSLNVSQSTIIRFSQKMGYRSFKHMLKEAKEINENDVSEIQLSDSTIETCEKIKDNYIELLHMTFDFIDAEEIERAVNYIYEASTVLCYGFLGTGSFAGYTATLLTELGINSLSSISHKEIMKRMMFCEAGDVVILFSKSGESHEVIDVAKAAISHGMKVIVVSQHMKSKLSSYADVHLKTAGSNLKTRLKANVEHCGQLFIIDAVILNLYKKDYKKFTSNATRYRKQMRYDY